MQHLVICNLQMLPARAAACGRETASIDRIAAYPQMKRDTAKHYSERLRRALTTDEGSVVRVHGSSVRCRVITKRFHLARFASWLIVNRRLTVPEAPALHDGDNAGASRRAVKAKECVDAEERAGRNVTVRVAENLSAKPWRNDARDSSRFFYQVQMIIIMLPFFLANVRCTM